MEPDTAFQLPIVPSREAVREARSAYASDAGVDHAVVSAWLQTWGKPGELSFKEWLDRQDG